MEISKDYDKFSIGDIDIGSSNLSIQLNKTSFKELLNDSMNDYIKLIHIPYQGFKQNHGLHVHYYKGKKSNSNEIYKTNVGVVNSVEKIYYEEEEKFKIKAEILEQKQDEIENTCRVLIEKCGTVEIELGKILEHSNKIQKYLTDNLEPIKEKVYLIWEKINSTKNIKVEIKRKFLMNSSELILKAIKKKNITKLHLYLSAFKRLKDILDLLKILITNPKKYKITFELLTKAKNTIDALKQSKRGTYKLFEYFENNYATYFNKVFEQMNNEFSSVLSECFANFFCIKQLTNPNTYSTFNISQYVFDKLTSSSEKANKILCNISFSEKVNIEKIINITQCYIKSDIINSFYPKMRGLLTSLSNEVMNKAIDSLNKEFSNDQSKNDSNSKEDITSFLNGVGSQVTVIADVEKNEQCILLCLIMGNQQMIKSISKITNVICQQITNSGGITNTKKYEVIKRNFHEEFDEILKIITSKKKDFLHGQMIKCLNESLNHSNIDSFIDNFYIIKDIVGQDKSFDNLFLKCQNEYITKWYQDKLKKFDSNLYQNWEDIKEIPSNYQNLLDIFNAYEIKDNYMKDDAVSPFEKINQFSKLESLFQITDSQGYITIGTMKLKCNQCSLDIIRTSYEVLKLFSLLSPQTWGNILLHYKILLSSYGLYQNEQILNGKNQVVSQTEISMTYSIIELIRQLRSKFIKSESFNILIKNIDKKIVDEFIDLNNLFDNMIHSSKSKIMDLIDIHCVETALKELESINLPNYNVVEGEVPVNSYALTIVKLIKSIYESMLNAYEETFIISTIKTSLKKFFDRLEKYIFKGQKIEKENCLKQFKRDMVFMKKNISSLTLIDMTEFKNRIDNINKMVIPENMFNNKK